MSGCHLLLIEDDDAVRRALQLLLTGQGFQVHAFASATLALADPGALAAGFLVIDYLLGESSGIEALGLLRSRGWQGRAVLITAHYSPHLHEEALQAGFDGVIAKPFRDATLLAALNGDVASSG